MDDCLRLVKEKGLTDVMLFFPKTKTIEEEYRKADFFCLPSFYEGTPNVLCEALASSLPAISSRVCDNPHYVHEGENGFLFDPHQPADIASKLEAALCLTDTQYGEYCLRSRAIAEQTMSGKVFVEKYLSLL
jgi:glycosyltransferase involved in cell wall biosynthesis